MYNVRTSFLGICTGRKEDNSCANTPCQDSASDHFVHSPKEMCVNFYVEVLFSISWFAVFH